MTYVPNKYEQLDQKVQTLADVENVTPNNNDVLVYVTANNRYEPQAIPASPPSLGDYALYRQVTAVSSGTNTRNNSWSDGGFGASFTSAGNLVNVAGPILQWTGVSGAILQMFGCFVVRTSVIGQSYQLRMGLGISSPTEILGTVSSTPRSSNITDYDNCITLNNVFVVNNNDYIRLQDRNGTTGNVSCGFDANSFTWGIRRIG